MNKDKPTDILVAVDVKNAIQYANKTIVKKCADGLMKDVMKVAISWFLRVAYGDGYVLAKSGLEWDEDQLSLFDENYPVLPGQQEKP